MSEPPMTPSDLELVNAARGGDRDSFETLVNRHYDLIFRISFQVMKDPDEARDLTHNLCMKLPAKLKSFGGRSRFKTWLYRAVVNEARDRWRRNKARRKHEDKFAERHADNGAVDGGQPEPSPELDLATSLLKRLPKGMRETFCLVDVLEYSQEEAAEVLGVAVGTVGWRMHIARKRLNAWIAQEEERVS